MGGGGGGIVHGTYLIFSERKRTERDSETGTGETWAQEMIRWHWEQGEEGEKKMKGR